MSISIVFKISPMLRVFPGLQKYNVTVILEEETTVHNDLCKSVKSVEIKHFKGLVKSQVEILTDSIAYVQLTNNEFEVCLNSFFSLIRGSEIYDFNT